MSAALSVFVWHTIQTNLGALDMFHAIVIASSIGLFLSIFVLAAFICTVREMIIIAAAFPFGFLLVMGNGVVAAILSFLFFLYGVLSMRFQIHNRIKVSFYPLISYGTPAAITGLAILFAFMGYSYPLRVNGSITIPEAVIRPVMPLVESFIASQAPGYTNGMTVDEFLSTTATEALRQKYGSASLANKQVQAALAEAVKKQRNDLSKQLGVLLEGKERAGDVMREVVDTYVHSYLVSYKEFIPIVVAVSVFLATKSIGFFASRIAVAVAWLFARVLLATRVIEKKKEQTERETLFV